MIIMNPNFELNINPDILKWARTSAGFTIEEITCILKKKWKTIKNDSLLDWENGINKPTFTQLVFLSEKYKRPLAVFFSIKKPKEENVPPEFRILADKGLIGLTPDVLLAIRKARNIQENIKYVSELLKADYKTALPKYNIKDTTPQILAKNYREIFNYNQNTVRKISKNETPFNYIRNLIENKNCIVIKSTYNNSFNSYNARAFSLVDTEPFLINITNDDTETGKLFSLLHEFCHVLLRENSIIAGNEINTLLKNDRIEKFCNEFAGNFLVSKEDLIEYYEKYQDNDTEVLVDRLANIFKVSPFVMLIRLKETNLISKQDCDILFKNKEKNYHIIKSSFAINKPQKDIFNRLGKRVVNLFVQAEVNEKISYTDISDFLDIKPRYLSDIYKICLNG